MNPQCPKCGKTRHYSTLLGKWACGCPMDQWKKQQTFADLFPGIKDLEENPPTEDVLPE